MNPDLPIVAAATVVLLSVVQVWHERSTASRDERPMRRRVLVTSAIAFAGGVFAVILLLVNR